MDSMNIFSFNLDSKETSLLKIKTNVQTQEPLLVLLQDLPSRAPTELISLLNSIAPDYKVIPSNLNIAVHSEEKTSIKPNNVILVHPEVTVHKELVQPKQTASYSSGAAEAIGVDFRLKPDGPIHRIFSLYIRPRACFFETRDTLEWISSESRKIKDRLIVMGDVNADAHEWTPANYMLLNCIKKGQSNLNAHDYRGMKINRGITITNFMRTNKLNCLNRPELGPTYVMRRGYANSSAFIDVALVGPKAARTWRDFKLFPIEEAEHRLVQISREYKRSEAAQVIRDRLSNNQDKFRLAFYKINQNMFTDFKAKVKSMNLRHPRRDYDKQVKAMNILAMHLSYKMLSVQEAIKVRCDPYRRERPQSGLYTQLRVKMIKKMKALRQKQKGLYKYGRRYKHYGKIQKNIKHKIYTGLARAQRLQDDVSNPEILDETWNCIGKIDRNDDDWVRSKESILDTNSGQFFTSSKQLEEECRKKFQFKLRNSREMMRRVIDSGEIVACIVKIEELDMAIDRLRKKKYTGIDGVNLRTLTESYEFIREEVYQVCRMSFQVAKLPENCHISHGKLVPKQEAGKYRIVHLSTAMSALLEQVALIRLEYRLEHFNLLSPDQFAFTANVSRHDLVTHILATAHRRLQTLKEKTSTILVSLDIEGAFDNVDQDALISKMMKDMPCDNIRYWLANFMLDKKVVVKDRMFSTRPIDICTGVPQGSSLGPVLWNYMINDIGNSLRGVKDCNIELLAYADDLYVLFTGSRYMELQLYLNQVSHYLAGINLRVNPKKSKQIDFHRMANERHKPLIIGGSSIKSVNRINILGVHIHRRLKLDRPNFSDFKLARNMRRLYFMNRLKLMHFNFQWDAMTDGLIRSITSINYYPILALDPKSQKWMDQMIDRVIRNIFRWPKNVSIKLVRLITGTLRTEIDVKNQINQRMLKARDNTGYKHLAEVMSGTDDSLKDETLQKLSEMAVRRRYHNPTKLLFIRNHENIEEFEGASWVPIESRIGTIMVKQMFGEILAIKCGVHSDYPVSYFNTMAMIWHLAKSDEEYPKVVTFGKSDPLLAAMQNWKNHDWRTIQTKELIIERGWKILRISNGSLYKLREKLSAMIKLQHVPIRQLSEPDVTDYRLRHCFNYEFDNAKEVEATNDHTTVTKGLCEDAKVWQKLNRSSVSSVAMLALTGVMTTPDNPSLFHGKLQPGQTPHGCTTETCTSSDSISHTTVHRVRYCPKYKEERAELFQADPIALEPEKKDIKAVMKYRTSSGKFLRLVTKCAFDKDNFLYM